MENKINELFFLMINYMAPDARRIQHFTKVHSYAKLLGEKEGLEAHELFVLECASLVHDIGIKNGEAKYGKCTGKIQEEEGPGEARKLLEKLSFAEKDIERICYLVGHHHTYNNIDGLDYQILVEADFLVNFYEDNCSKEAVTTALGKIFKTPTGIAVCKTMFGL